MTTYVGSSAVTSVPGSTGSVTVLVASSMIAGTFRESSSTLRIAVGSAPSASTSVAESARL